MPDLELVRVQNASGYGYRVVQNPKKKKRLQKQKLFLLKEFNILFNLKSFIFLGGHFSWCVRGL